MAQKITFNIVIPTEVLLEGQGEFDYVDFIDEFNATGEAWDVIIDRVTGSLDNFEGSIHTQPARLVSPSNHRITAGRPATETVTTELKKRRRTGLKRKQ